MKSRAKFIQDLSNFATPEDVRIAREIYNTERLSAALKKTGNSNLTSWSGSPA